MSEASLIENAFGDPWFPAAEVVAGLHDAAAAGRAVAGIAERVAGRTDVLEVARLARLADLIIDRFPDAARAWRDARCRPPARVVSDAVAAAVRVQVDLPNEPARASLVPGQMVVATAPVRLDLAGGWSDTPPICNERGGTVVNVAMRLEGRQPIQAVAQLSEEPVIRITSIDLGRSVEITSTAELLGHDGPGDWSALPKTALVLAGLAPASPSNDLSEWLRGVGGGVRLTVFAAVPKGSGLGTSSILGAVVLAALFRLRGEEGSTGELIRRTSMLEQMMGTGGGWQDQCGGLVPGFKILRTDPGPDQTPRIQSIGVPPDAARELAARTVLYYTGCQRVAANILQNVVGRYLARDPECHAIVRDLKAGAERMAGELASGDLDGFGASLQEFWSLKCRFDPGAMTREIESMLEPVRGELSGYELPGAGGGGFLLLIAKDAERAVRVRERLSLSRPNETARLTACAVDPDGLRVSVL